MRSGVAVAGPSVATIFVRRIMAAKDIRERAAEGEESGRGRERAVEGTRGQLSGISHLSTLYQGKHIVEKSALLSFLVMAASGVRLTGMGDVLKSCGNYG